MWSPKLLFLYLASLSVSEAAQMMGTGECAWYQEEIDFVESEIVEWQTYNDDWYVENLPNKRTELNELKQEYNNCMTGTTPAPESVRTPAPVASTPAPSRGTSKYTPGPTRDNGEGWPTWPTWKTPRPTPYGPRPVGPRPVDPRPTSPVSPGGRVCNSRNGEYGSLGGSEDVVSYGYQLVLNSTMNVSLEEDVLPSLENAFTDALLPTLFDWDGCVAGNTRRRLDAVGISKIPEDRPMDNKNCSFVQNGTECYIIRGELTIYEEQTSRRLGGHYEDEVRETLRQAMLSRAFDKDIEESILSVTYVQLADVNETETSDDDDDRVDEDISLYVAIASGALLVCLVCYIVINMMRGDSEPDADKDGDDKDDDEEE